MTFGTFVRTVVAVALAAAVAAAQAPTGQALFEQALSRERADGNLQEAIRLYERVVRDFASDRALAARALVQIGLCYEKLGRQDALRTYERLIRDFGDQKEAVLQARARLAALERTPVSPTAMTTRRIWADPYTDSFGSPSPDGRYLSFVDWETGDLALRDLTTGQNRHLTSKGSWADSPEFAESSVISPDGRQIAYSWFNGVRYELRVAPLDTMKPRTLSAAGDIAYVQIGGWTADSRTVLVAYSHENAGHELALVHVPDGSSRAVKRFSDPRWPDRVTISPDGRFVVYDLIGQEPADTRDLFLVDALTGAETRLTAHPRDDMQPIWTPDGRHVLFLSDRTGTMAAWLQEVDEGKPVGSPRMFKADMARTVPMGFTRAGSLVYGVAAGLRDIYTAEIDASVPRLVKPPAVAVDYFTGTNSFPDVSPDGSRVVYASQRGLTANGRNAVLLCTTVLGSGKVEEIRLPFSNFQRPRWSPDGKSVLVTALLNGRFGVYRVDLASAQVTPLRVSQGLGSVYAAQWWPDGESILFNEGIGNQTRLIRRFLDSGREQVLLAVSGGSGGDTALSPDGRLLAVRVWEPGPAPNSVIKILPSAGGAARELVRAPMDGLRGVAWTADGRYVLYVQNVKNRCELWRVDVETRETKPVGLAQVGINNLRVAADGRRVVFGAGEWRQEVWILENAFPRTGTN